ncbi:hypothetical protein PC121_g22570 [Phytophthora cactorum]|nr:hypothetical protein PC121_g22570 [Phytophthora cactorum]
MNTQLQKPRRQTTISLATRSCRLLHSHLTARRDRPGALVQQSSQFCLGNSSVSSTSALLSSSWTITATVLSSNSSAILIPAIASSGSARPDSVIPSSNSVGVTNCSAYDQTSGVSVEGSGSAVFRACASAYWASRLVKFHGGLRIALSLSGLCHWHLSTPMSTPRPSSALLLWL